MMPYKADKLPLKQLDYQRLLPLIGQANAALARYDGFLQGIPNPSVMLSPLTNQEAVLSSKIEGTQATVDEVLEHEAGLIKDGEKHKDIQEIINYRSALFSANEHLTNYPIRLSFIRQLHHTLMDSVRGQDKNPGEFRQDQNWIGHQGCTLEQATFVPPNPMLLPDFLQELENYMDSDDADFLLQTAVVHAQFELLHPFKDGNGRIGRILIPLFLYQKKALSQPMFYLSQYLENNRQEYYARLQAISVKQDWDGWIAFFLQAIIEQAKQNSTRVSDIQVLYEDMKGAIHAITHSQYNLYLLDAIFTRPIFRSSDLAAQLFKEFNIHKKTTLNLIRRIKDAGILSELQAGSGSRPATLCFPRLINLAEGKQVI